MISYLKRDEVLCEFHLMWILYCTGMGNTLKWYGPLFLK